jgi:hypothetical protein
LAGVIRSPNGGRPAFRLDGGFGRHPSKRSGFTRDRFGGVLRDCPAGPSERAFAPSPAASNVGRPAVQARRLVRLQGSTGVSRPCASTAREGGRLFMVLNSASSSLREFEEGRRSRRPGSPRLRVETFDASHRALNWPAVPGVVIRNFGVPLTRGIRVPGRRAMRSPHCSQQRHQRSAAPCHRAGDNPVGDLIRSIRPPSS